ncbi:MAG TPA: MBL fold metallo-hydrolase [Bacillota bacterium]|nr:MBL fold metallo-hydrolase [Bacillota bacterium]
MIFTYLGTAAAEGWPALFCECDNCNRAMNAGGKNIRKRSQALVDDKLLIDFPADTYASMKQIGFSLANLHTLIITHSHSDHLYPEDLVMRSDVFAHFKDRTPLSLYGTKEVIDRIKYVAGDINARSRKDEQYYTLNVIKPFDTFISDGYTITALPADHDPSSGPVFYSISDGCKNVLYAHDTGYFKDEVWEYLESSDVVYNFVSLDCTNVVLPWRTGHMGIEACVDTADRMRKIGRADKHTVFCVNHFSHNGGKIYDELVPMMKEYGMLVSFDGMKLEF